MKRFLKTLGLVALLFFFPFGRGRRLDFFGYAVVFVLLFVPFGGWKLLESEIQATEEEPAEYGAVYDVPEFQWAMVMNRYGVQTEDILLARFENCLLRYRGQVAEITNHSTWWSTWKDRALVEYTPPVGAQATGVLCPDGTRFYLPREELAAFPDRFAQRRQYEEQLAGEVTDALHQRQAGNVEQVDEFFSWVEVVNPQGVENFGYQVPFLDICGIEARGRVQQIGNTSQGSLYEYTPDPERGFLGIGIPCPAKTLFLFDAGRPASAMGTGSPWGGQTHQNPST